MMKNFDRGKSAKEMQTNLSDCKNMLKPTPTISVKIVKEYL